MPASLKYTKEFLEPIVARSTSWSDVARICGVTPNSGGTTHIKGKTIEYGIPYEHFDGGASKRLGNFNKKVDVEVYFRNERHIGSNKLREKLYREGIKLPECEICGIKEWRGERVPFHLDHIDENPNNNSLNNLQILCPNCHSQKTSKAHILRMTKPARQCTGCEGTAGRYSRSGLCGSCAKRLNIANSRKPKIEWPDLTDLKKMVEDSGYVNTGKLLGVSDVAVRKHIKTRS